MVRYALAGDLLDELSRNWWLVVLRGAAAVLLGLVALVWPEKTLVALALVFGVYALADGAVLGYVAYRAAPGSRMALVVQAVVSALVGLVALIWPLVTVLALVFVIGLWAVLTGIAEIVTAIRLREHIGSEWLLIFVGALSVVFGLLLWFWPLEGARAIMFVIAMYAIVFGAVLAVAGFGLRSAAEIFPEGKDVHVGLTQPDDPVGEEPMGDTPHRGWRDGDLLDDGDEWNERPPGGGGRHRSPENGEGRREPPDELR